MENVARLGKGGAGGDNLSAWGHQIRTSLYLLAISTGVSSISAGASTSILIVKSTPIALNTGSLSRGVGAKKCRITQTVISPSRLSERPSVGSGDRFTARI